MAVWFCSRKRRLHLPLNTGIVVVSSWFNTYNQQFKIRGSVEDKHSCIVKG